MPALGRVAIGADLSSTSGAQSQFQPLMLAHSNADVVAALTPLADRMSDINVFLPMVKITGLIIIVPILLMLIFRTERKHVKYDYQLAAAKRAHVRLEKTPGDKELQEPEKPMFVPQNNFKLVSGSGYVTALKAIED